MRPPAPLLKAEPEGGNEGKSTADLASFSYHCLQPLSTECQLWLCSNIYPELTWRVIITAVDDCLERFCRLSGLVQYKMKVIIVVVLALWIAAANLSCSGLSTCSASTAELSEAAKNCYAEQHLPNNVNAYDQFTVRDLQVVSKKTGGAQGQIWTVWVVRAKLYDPDDQYVEDIEETLVKMSFGWTCR